MRFSFLIVILPVIFFLGCEEITTFNPLDPENNPDFTPPETTITTENIAGTLLDSSSVTIAWEGNDNVIEFSYSLDSLYWSEWSVDTSVTLEYIDEGNHDFYVKGRYASLTEDDSPASVSFEVDVMSGPGLRVQKWMSEATVLDTITIDIYAEEVTDLVLAEFQVSYDVAVLSLVNSAKGDMLAEIETSAFVLEGTPGLLHVNFTTLEHTGLSGSGSVVNLKFLPLMADSTSIDLQNIIFKDINGHNFTQEIEIRPGIVIIE